LTPVPRSPYKKPVQSKEPPGTFVVADLNSRGELELKADYQYRLLEQVPGAAELIGTLSGFLWRSPDGFDESLPAGGSALAVRWRPSGPTAGIATLRGESDDLVSLTLLVCGLNEEQDRLTLQAFQQHLLRGLHDTGYEPAFALMDLRDRPLAATINFQPPPDDAARRAAALADRCFAAAYFRYHGLA
jgi:hypothetical protein